jgi:HKD family nuclease
VYATIPGLLLQSTLNTKNGTKILYDQALNIEYISMYAKLVHISEVNIKVHENIYRSP